MRRMYGAFEEALSVSPDIAACLRSPGAPLDVCECSAKLPLGRALRRVVKKRHLVIGAREASALTRKAPRASKAKY